MLKHTLFAATVMGCGLLAPPDRISGQDQSLAFTGARILTMEGESIADGTMVIQGGRILALGTAQSVTIPKGAEIRDLSGRTLMPGLVDTHSHIGGAGAADGSGPLQPGVRVYESLNARDSGFRRAVAGGLTTLNIMPGSGHLSSGQTVYVKLREGNTLEDLVYRNGDGSVAGGLKMANGTNSQKAPPYPGTRGKSAALVRAKFIEAQEYRAKMKRAGEDASKRPKRDLDLETLVEVLDRKRVVHHHTHRHDDIVTVLRLAEEFGFRVVLHHVSEGWKVADQIAAAGVPCSAILVDSPGGKLETVDLSFSVGAVLEQAGVATAFHTDDFITDSRLFLRSAGLAVRGGMSEMGALRALTIEGAKMLDLEDRIGSLKVGKDADFIVLDGPPLSTYTKVLETWVEGQQVFDRKDPQDRLYAVGGYGASHNQSTYLCCFDHDGKE